MLLTTCFIRLVVQLGVVSRVTPAPLSPPSVDGQPVVDLEYSQYQGIRLSSGVNQYLGMRYAAPPLGDLRFRAPANPLKTSGVQDATLVVQYGRFLGYSTDRVPVPSNLSSY